MRRALLLAAALLACRGQLTDVLPTLVRTSRNFIDVITKNTFASDTSQASSNLLLSSVDTLTRIPTDIARNIGVGLQLPSIDNNRNILDSIDIGDFTSDIGTEDAHLNITLLTRKYGFQLEEHQVVTDDGYILTIFRIPGKGSPVFIQHGLLGCADDFVIAGPSSGLAYLLSRDGYDVWLGNARGSKHSRRHTRLRPSQAAFWDFSWHEIGVYDLPAVIDYILLKTDSKTVKYIGHSQGTTSFFVMASERPEYNEKVSLMVALSPVAYMSHIESPVARLMAPGTPFLHTVMKTIGMYEFLPDSNMMRTLKLVVCGLGPVSDLLCSNILFMMAGAGNAQLNVTNLPVLMGHTPAGASVKQLVHYGQGIVTGKFQQFDYGAEENTKRYGTKSPPEYQLENVSAAVCLFYSDHDLLSHPTDVDKLYNRLNNAVDIHKIPHKQFNHLDFIWAKDFKTLIYARVRKLFKYF